MLKMSLKALSVFLIISSEFILKFLTQYIVPLQEFNETILDVTKCKYSQLGTEYMGNVRTTAGGIQCQLWSAENPLHEVNTKIKGVDFPEKSMELAKNFCRNPTKDYRGPWCYTLDPSLIDDYCLVPLCNYPECRVTGTGAEYSGKVDIGTSKRRCKKWNKTYKTANGKTKKFASEKFPGSSRTEAGNYCRNPDDSFGGPWCYIEDENFEYVLREYCDIPFCDDRDCLVYTRNASVYSTVTKLKENIDNITLWIKLWDPTKEQEGEVRILLSLLPIPTYSEYIAEKWHAGVEILISNRGSGIVFPISKYKLDLENTPRILLATKWTGLSVTWNNGFLSISYLDSTTPIFTEEYKIKNSILSTFEDSFFYYGLSGTDVLLSTPFCQEDCEIRITYGLEFINHWPINQSNGTNEIEFYVRAGHYIAIRLFISPGIEFPSYTVIIGDMDTVSLIYQVTEESTKQHMKIAHAKNLLNFWSWNKFTLNIFGPYLRLYSTKSYGNEELLNYQSDVFISLRWFSIGNEKGVAMWTLFCSPNEKDLVKKPWPPECLSGPTDTKFEGTQWTSSEEIPCVPWISSQVTKDDKTDSNFPKNSVTESLNKCRNPSKDPNGPYCYVLSSKEKNDIISVHKNYCPIRICQSSECKMAGTANDYVGPLSITRSGRMCQRWFSEEYKSNNKTQVKRQHNQIQISESFIDMNVSSAIHTINSKYLNDSLYPENNTRKANNYCRNPSRNIAGSWCYTTDHLVPQDLCNVRDCDKPDECIFYVRGNNRGRLLYILPEYRSEGLSFSLKAWEPDNPDTITFVFASEDLKSLYMLKIGNGDNEKVSLYYKSKSQDLKLMKKKTLPHLIYLGKWSNFIIQIPRGSVKLFYDGATTPLFEWEHPPSSEISFLPVYYYYSTDKNHTIGIWFQCSSRCQVEITSTDQLTRILPISVWSQNEVVLPDKLQIMIRAKGHIVIPLFSIYDTSRFHELSFDQRGKKFVYFSLINKKKNNHVYHKQESSSELFTDNTWTNITLNWKENEMTVWCNETVIFNYEHRVPLLFYYFTIGAKSGSWATWTSNCLPPDVDGDPIDGGWSEWGPWICSASCNGGIGTRKRICNSPEPNIKGEPCLGPNIMTGRCNTIACGDIPENTMNSIKRNLRTIHLNIFIKEGQQFTILPEYEIILEINNQSPKSSLFWIHNGVLVGNDSKRIRVYNNKIDIFRASTIDSGVYSLIVERIDKSHTIIKIVSLAVIPQNEISIRETLPMLLQCNSIDLGYYYSDLTILWFVNNETWKNYGTTLPVAVNIDYVPKINRSHEGIWKCIVKQTDLGFEWTTNVIRIKGAPNWRTFLMEDKLTKWIFGWMPNESIVAVASVVIFLLLALCFFVGILSFFRYKNNIIRKIAGTKREDKEPLIQEEEQEPEEKVDNVERRTTVNKLQQVTSNLLNNEKVAKNERWNLQFLNFFKTKKEKSKESQRLLPGD